MKMIWFEKFMMSSAAFIVVICIAILCAIFPAEKIKCENLADMYRTETKFYYTNGCFIKDGDKWFQADLWLKFNLAKEKGISVNIVDMNNTKE